MKSYRYIISGKVQGVYYRQSTKNKAEELGIKGTAENLKTGEVEIFACGDEEALAEFEKWLWIGPPLAKVDRVEKTEFFPSDFQNFSIIRK